MEILKQTQAVDHLSEAAVQNISRWLSEAKYAEYRNELVKLLENGDWQTLEAGMRQRVEAAGGRLTVTSRAGHGTQISAILPTAPAVSLPSTALPG